MNTTGEKFDRYHLIRFADTQRNNYRKPLLDNLRANSVFQKLSFQLGIKKITIKTADDLQKLFHKTIMDSVLSSRSYDPSSPMHEKRIEDLENDYDKFLNFCAHFDDSNLEIDDDVLIERMATLDEAKFPQRYLTRIINKLQTYPLPLSDVFDIIDVIVENWERRKFSAQEKSNTIKDLLRNKMGNLYINGLENPSQRPLLVESLKNHYQNIESSNDLIKYDFKNVDKSFSESNIEIEE